MVGSYCFRPGDIYSKANYIRLGGLMAAAWGLHSAYVSKANEEEAQPWEGVKVELFWGVGLGTGLSEATELGRSWFRQIGFCRFFKCNGTERNFSHTNPFLHWNRRNS